MTYIEFTQQAVNGVLLNKVAAAIAVAAEAVRTESSGTTNHANRLLWAKAALERPNKEAERMIWGLLAQNVNLTVAQISAASDAAILTGVQNAIDLFATGP